MPPLTTAQRRAHYDDFVADVIGLCAHNGIRSDLASGRGRPVEHCERMQQHLAARIRRFGARRAHYTIAALIAQQRHLPHEDTPYTPEEARPAPAEDTRGHTSPTARPDSPPGTDSAANPPAQPGHRTWRARPNLGITLALAVTRHHFPQHRMDERVKTLTRLSTPLLHPRLWSLTSHLHSRNAARLDFAVLLEDLAWWDEDRPHTAARWRESYFLTLDSLTPQET
ncbi:type I-E CRISPR-associated protein Cse2/CasB [Streptomyces sp. NPDC054796]